mgnify:FL=1
MIDHVFTIAYARRPYIGCYDLSDKNLRLKCLRDNLALSSVAFKLSPTACLLVSRGAGPRHKTSRNSEYDGATVAEGLRVDIVNRHRVPSSPV